MRTKRGQSALEFMIIVSLAILVLAISLVIYINTNTDATALGNQAAASAACNQVVSVISAVTAGGNGAQTVLRLPPTIGGSDYNVSVNGSAQRVTVNYKGGFQACYFPTSNVTSKSNVSKTGNVTNSGGVILG
jgi:Tfp pilus assembly protein PilW